MSFWQAIAAGWEEADDDEAFLEAMEEWLESLPLAEVLSFDGHVDALHNASYSWRLWGAAYLINGGCSDDAFEYFRAWLISRGRDVYEAAIDDPNSLADHAPTD